MHTASPQVNSILNRKRVVLLQSVSTPQVLLPRNPCEIPRNYQSHVNLRPVVVQKTVKRPLVGTTCIVNLEVQLRISLNLRVNIVENWITTASNCITTPGVTSIKCRSYFVWQMNLHPISNVAPTVFCVVDGFTPCTTSHTRKWIYTMDLHHEFTSGLNVDGGTREFGL